MIYVYNPVQLSPDQAQKSYKGHDYVGGFCCFGQTLSENTVSFDKTLYYLGEQAKVSVNIDNKACKIKILGVKMKLKRRFWATQGKHTVNYSHDLAEMVDRTEVEAGELKTIDLSVTIPTEDPTGPKQQEKATAEMEPMLNAFSSSVNTSLIRVEYFLELYINYDNGVFGSDGFTNHPI